MIHIRKDGYRKDAVRLARVAFGDYESVGGHQGPARAEIPLNTLKQMGIKGYGSSIKSFIRKRLRF